MTYRKKQHDGMGMVVVALGLLFFIMTILLISTLPFEITATEQAVLYLTSVVVILAGIVLMVSK
jgi:hypothetical protein